MRYSEQSELEEPGKRTYLFYRFIKVLFCSIPACLLTPVMICQKWLIFNEADYSSSAHDFAHPFFYHFHAAVGAKLQFSFVLCLYETKIILNIMFII